MRACRKIDRREQTDRRWASAAGTMRTSHQHKRLEIPQKKWQIVKTRSPVAVTDTPYLAQALVFLVVLYHRNF
jgi:hypothetical protein